MESTSSNSHGPVTILALMETEMLKGKLLELEHLSIENKRRHQEEQDQIKKDADERLEQLKLSLLTEMKQVEDKYKLTLQRVNFLGGRCVKLMIENEKLTTENHEMSEELNLFKACKDGEEARKLVEEERSKTAECHKKMLNAQEKLREQQEKSEGDSKPWRLCQICDEEYSEVLEHTPRMLFCGHTFCYSCCLRSAKDVGIQCPYCRSFCPVEKKALEDDLPVNFALLHM